MIIAPFKNSAARRYGTSHTSMTTFTQWLITGGIRTMARQFWYFYRTAPTQIAAIIVLLVVTGLLENVGILTMLPALQIAMQSEFANSQISAMIVQAMGSVGLKPTLLAILGLSAAVVAAKVVLTMAVGAYSSVKILDMVCNLRQAIVGRLLRARWSHFAEARTGKYVNLLGAETDRAVPTLNQGVFLISDIVHAVLYLASACLVSVRLSMVALGLGVLKLLMSRPIIAAGRHAGRQQSKSIGSLGSHLVEIIHMAKPIKAMAREADAERILTVDMQKHRMAQRNTYLSSHALTNFDELMFSIMLLACFYVSVEMLHIGFAELAVIGVLMSRTLRKVAQIQKRYFAALTGEAALGGLIKTMTGLEGQQEVAHGGEAPTLTSSIEFRKASVSYPGVALLANVNMEIPARSLSVLVGPSGSGKTTLIDALLGLTPLAGGDIRIDGKSIRDIDLSLWRGMTGYVPQETVLLHGTIRDNITFRAENITDDDVITALQLAEALDFVRALPKGLDAEVGERGLKLSGGQRQRLAIARALVRKPNLLILDEVTSALDEATELELCRTFRRIAEQVTLIAVSHQPAICQLADRIYRIEGKCVMPGQGNGVERPDLAEAS
ncbi:MAG: ABC transporter ATP-binding protein [Thermodesulfobacteriota bacterium]